MIELLEKKEKEDIKKYKVSSSKNALTPFNIDSLINSAVISAKQEITNKITSKVNRQKELYNY